CARAAGSTARFASCGARTRPSSASPPTSRACGAGKAGLLVERDAAAGAPTAHPMGPLARRAAVLQTTPGLLGGRLGLLRRGLLLGFVAGGRFGFCHGLGGLFFLLRLVGFFSLLVLGGFGVLGVVGDFFGVFGGR